VRMLASERKITQLGAAEQAAAKVIDANGAHVAPGFIDLHCHYDAQLHWDPYCSIGSWHGSPRHQRQLGFRLCGRPPKEPSGSCGSMEATSDSF